MGIDGPVTPEELDEISRRYRYRRGLKFGDIRFAIAAALASIFLPIIGFLMAVESATLAERFYGIVLCALGLAVAALSLRYLARRVRPDRDDDFEREFRHKGPPA